MAGVGERVHHHHPRRAVRQRVAHEVAADEAGAAGDDQGLHGQAVLPFNPPQHTGSRLRS